MYSETTDSQEPALARGQAALNPSGHARPAKRHKLRLVVRFFPILVFLAYLSFTVLMFAFGPWPYPVYDGTDLCTFLICAHLALLLGYASATGERPHGYVGRLPVRGIVWLSVFVSLVLLFPTSKFRTGSWIPNVLMGVRNPGVAYQQSAMLRQQGTPIVEYTRILMGPLLACVLPLAVFYRKRLPRALFWLAGIVVVGQGAIYVAMGTNKGLADTILVGLWLLLAGHLAGVSRIKARQWIMLAVSGLVVVSLFLAFFTAGMSTRSGSGAQAGYFSAVGIYADPSNFMVRNLPPTLRVGVYGLSTYLTQGYYALYLSLQEPFVSMFGVGNSIFLSEQAASLFGPQVLEMSYPARIEHWGWRMYGLWSSIYPWIASDVSFPGTVLVVFVIGRLFARSWLDTLRGDNPFAVVVFAQFCIMLAYFPANNQMLQSGESLTGFYGILALWILTRRRYVWGKARSAAPVRCAGTAPGLVEG